MGSHQQGSRGKKLAEVALALVGYIPPELKAQDRRDNPDDPEALARGIKAESAVARPIPVHRKNWYSARVFEVCEWVVEFPGMGNKPIFLGIESTEILAAARMLKVPRRKYKKVMDDIKFKMAPYAKMYLNTGKVEL